MAEEEIQRYNQGELNSVKIIYGRTNTVIYELGNNEIEVAPKDEIPMLKAGSEPAHWPSGTLISGNYSWEYTTSFPIENFMQGINCTFRCDTGFSTIHRLYYNVGSVHNSITCAGNGAEKIALYGNVGDVCNLEYRTESGTGRCIWAVY